MLHPRFSFLNNVSSSFMGTVNGLCLASGTHSPSPITSYAALTNERFISNDNTLSAGVFSIFVKFWINDLKSNTPNITFTLQMAHAENCMIFALPFLPTTGQDMRSIQCITSCAMVGGQSPLMKSSMRSS